MITLLSFLLLQYFLYTSNIRFSFFAQYEGAPLEYMDVLADCNLVFTILFTIECVMKLTSFGPKVNTKRHNFFLHFKFKHSLRRWNVKKYVQTHTFFPLTGIF